MKIDRLFDLQDHIAENFPDKEDVFAEKKEGKWVKLGVDDYKRKSVAIANFLIEKGIKPGDTIATISNNRPEWNLVDMGIMISGAVHVPIYPTISESDYKFILNHAEVKMVFVEGKELLRKIEHILPQAESIQEVFTFNEIDKYRNVNSVIEEGLSLDHHEEIEKRKAAIKTDDLATLIYTSGTTGFPKGVMLSHQNILFDIMAIEKIPPIDHTCYAVSFLPLCHVYERMLNYFYQFKGVSVYYAQSIGTITQDMQDVRPQIMTTVPRLLEKIYDRIMAKGRKLTGLKRIIFFWAINLGLKYDYHNNSWFYNIQLKIADKLVFKKWREVMGNRMRVMVSGGAALQERLARSFWAAGIPVLEGYGLTETSPVIAVNHFGEGGLKFGTVGPPVKGIEVKIDVDGEILAKGPIVMTGYYKDKERTNEVLDKDGWFHTGDIGRLEPEGQLKITGRKKAIFKTSFGKYISPEHIENKLKESPFIDTALIIGENQKFAAALIIPSFEHIRNWCRVKEISCEGGDKEMINKPEVKKRIQREVDFYNTQLGDTEKVKRIKILDHEWTVETGELTASMKLKRDFICSKYKDTITKIFA